MFRFRIVSRFTPIGSLGKEMGKLLGNQVQRSDNSQKCFLCNFAHLIYMDQNLPCDTKPCRILRTVGVCL